MRYQPLPGRVFVEIELKDEVTKGGIFLSRGARIQMGQNKFATVLAAHPDEEVSAGDRVLLNNFVSEEYPDKGNLRQMFINIHNIVGVVEPAA